VALATPDWRLCRTVIFIDGDAYVKKYHQSDSGIQLISLNKKYAPIQVTSGSILKTFGKVVG